MKINETGICGLEDIVVLPEHRQKGYGKELLDFCESKARELGASKIRFGMIDENKRLKKWYEDNGCICIGYRKYEGAPFTVCRMEFML